MGEVAGSCLIAAVGAAFQFIDALLGFAPVSSSLLAIYHVTSDAPSIDDRARAIAVEQSVEMPVAAIEDGFVRSEIVGRVEGVRTLNGGRLYEVRIALNAETVGNDAGQLINMLFGNTSLHDDVVLHDVEFPAAMVEAFGGPRYGPQGLRQRVTAGQRGLTCSALKPQGLPAAELAELAVRFAQGGIDYIKDDHGLADQSYSPFGTRVRVVSEVLREGRERTTRYVPSLSGDFDTMRSQIAAATDAGVDTVMVAPLIAGLANFHRLVREHAGVAFFAHPAMAGAARIAPPLLLGKIFRMLGADAIVFPNHGGRFGYSAETCLRLAGAARDNWHRLLPTMPVPAGGMTRERVPEMLDFYGADIMLLIGGALLEARERLVETTADFVAEVKSYRYG